MVIGILGGTLAAFFLLALQWASQTHQHSPALIFALPLVGFGVSWCYQRYGKSVDAGNNLVLEAFHQPESVTIPLRMVPMILISTILSHLFGASVGREGTAVQMGGAIASQVAHRGLNLLSASHRQTLILCGISAGFAGVFGTPLAAGLFAIEVVITGRFQWRSLLPCLLAAALADGVCRWWGIEHSHFPTLSSVPPSGSVIAGVVMAGLTFGLLARFFVRAVRLLGAFIQQHIRYTPLRPLLGGLVLVILSLLFEIQDYLGLGVAAIESAFEQTPVWYASFCKLALTALSLASGFKGGEVTPLFFMGSTLGSALAPWLGLPIPFLAGLGLVAVFGGATKTPVACSVMACELLGIHILPYAALTCFVAYWISGMHSIYSSQARMNWRIF